MGICFVLSNACKVIDCFSGKPLESAAIALPNNRFINKGYGIYAISNLPDGEYCAIVTCKGYDDKKYYFDVPNDGEIRLVPMISSVAGERYTINGKLSVSNKPLINSLFYYTVNCDEFKRRITTNLHSEDEYIRIQNYKEVSLEGRKFALGHNGHVHTIGSFDYSQQNYKLKEKCSNDLEAGEFVHMLLEGQTDSIGEFKAILPRHALQKPKEEFTVIAKGRSATKLFMPSSDNLYLKINLTNPK